MKRANTHDLTSTHAHRHTVQTKQAEQFSSHGPCIHRRLTLHISVSREKTGSVACYRKWHHRKLPRDQRTVSDNGDKHILLSFPLAVDSLRSLQV